MPNWVSPNSGNPEEDMRSDTRRAAIGIPIAVAVSFTVTACTTAESDIADSAPAAAAASDTVVACTGDNAGLTLPQGVCASVFADSIGPARHIVVAENGDVYAALEGTGGPGSNPPGAAVVALRDTTGDGRADVTARIGVTGNTGIELHGGYLYVDEGETIVRYRRGAQELMPSGAREVVVQGIPLRPGHLARSVAIGNDGALYVNVGSISNSCQQRDRTAGSPGRDPCTELETRAGIWKFDANRTGQFFTREARYATGIRNAVALAINPADGSLWVAQHGRDQLHDNWKNVFPSPAYQAENPAEELFQVAQGDDFGWPYCYYSMEEKTRVTAPEYGGDGKKTDRCTTQKAPVAVHPGHWAPMALHFYTGNTLPPRYRDGVFITFHGSWNRAPEPQAGYNVVFQPLSGGRASGDFEVFADGFAGLPAGEIQPDRARHRPVGIAQGPDGALYIGDDAGGRIYRLTSARQASR